MNDLDPTTLNYDDRGLLLGLSEAVRLTVVASLARARSRVALVAVVEAVEGTRVLDVDPGADTNRTVLTFVGETDLPRLLALVKGCWTALFAGFTLSSGNPALDEVWPTYTLRYKDGRLVEAEQRGPEGGIIARRTYP